MNIKGKITEIDMNQRLNVLAMMQTKNKSRNTNNLRLSYVK